MANELQDVIKQYNNETIEDFDIHIRLYIDLLKMDKDSEDLIAMLRRKCCPEYEKAWQSMKDTDTWEDWIKAGEALEFKPSFYTLKQACAAKKHCAKCGKNSHWTSNHRDFSAKDDKKEDKQKAVCRNFAKDGNCPRGKKCHFKHVKVDSTKDFCQRQKDRRKAKEGTQVRIQGGLAQKCDMFQVQQDWTYFVKLPEGKIWRFSC